MQPDDRTRLLHLREAAEKCLHFTEDKHRSDLDQDELLRLALTKLIEIVGEAAKYVQCGIQRSPSGGALAGGGTHA